MQDILESKKKEHGLQAFRESKWYLANSVFVMAGYTQHRKQTDI
jgi:hypothetical protein